MNIDSIGTCGRLKFIFWKVWGFGIPENRNFRVFLSLEVYNGSIMIKTQKSWKIPLLNLYPAPRKFSTFPKVDQKFTKDKMF